MTSALSSRNRCNQVLTGYLHTLAAATVFFIWWFALLNSVITAIVSCQWLTPACINLSVAKNIQQAWPSRPHITGYHWHKTIHQTSLKGTEDEASSFWESWDVLLWVAGKNNYLVNKPAKVGYYFGHWSALGGRYGILQPFQGWCHTGMACTYWYV